MKRREWQARPKEDPEDFLALDIEVQTIARSDPSVEQRHLQGKARSGSRASGLDRNISDKQAHQPMSQHKVHSLYICTPALSFHLKANKFLDNSPSLSFVPTSFQSSTQENWSKVCGMIIPYELTAQESKQKVNQKGSTLSSCTRYMKDGSLMLIVGT